MRDRRFTIVLFTILANIGWTASVSAMDGWLWNPFGSKSKSSVESKSSSSWMPSWSNPFAAKSSVPKNQPSMWSRMSRTTKRWWNNTVDFLRPYPKESEYTRSSRSSNSSGWLSWFSKEEKKKYSDVNDFLRQPSP